MSDKTETCCDCKHWEPIVNDYGKGKCISGQTTTANKVACLIFENRGTNDERKQD